MQKIFEIEQGVPEICPRGQVSPGGKCRRGQVSGGQMSRSPPESSRELQRAAADLKSQHITPYYIYIMHCILS